MPKVPHHQIVILFCLLAVSGYAACSVWAVLISHDAAIIGDVVGTWKSFAVAAFAFWVGSSSGGKARDAVASNNPTGEEPSPDPKQAGA